MSAGAALRPAGGAAPALALMGAAALAAALRQDEVAAAAVAALLGAVFALLALVDAASRRLPNAIVLPALGLALCSWWAWPDRGPFDALAGAALAALPMAIACGAGRGALGGGDVKMAGLVGAAAGYPAALGAMLAATGSAALAAAALLALRPGARRATMPYGPFLALGGMAGLLL